jgi:transcriptional regulator with XRE-family HTH domain
LNQSEIAELLNVTQQMISAVVAGERRLSYDRAKKASELFGVDVEIFMQRRTDEIRKAFDRGPLKHK